MSELVRDQHIVERKGYIFLKEPSTDGGMTGTNVEATLSLSLIGQVSIYLPGKHALRYNT